MSGDHLSSIMGKMYSMVQVRPIRVLIIDNHEIVRQGLSILMEVFDDFELVGEADSGEQGLNLCAAVQPDVVMIEMRLPTIDGLTATRMITRTYPHIRVVAMSASEPQASIDAILEAGASGYLVKNVGIDAVAETIRAAARQP